MSPGGAPHWREYLIEGWGLGTFMLSACVFGTWLFHPDSPMVDALGSPLARRGLMGVFMGLTLIGLVYSPWGRRSGAHMNPAVTLAFWRLGRIAPGDAIGYITAQFVGGAVGVWSVGQLLGMALGHPEVSWVVTRPGPSGRMVALAAEFFISAAQLTLVLHVASSRWRQYTGLCAAIGLALYILIESPLSGTSMNPARTVASAVVAGDWTAVWIYFVAPVSGMMSAALWYAVRHTPREIPCGKMAHAEPCLFCEHVARRQENTSVAVSPRPTRVR